MTLQPLLVALLASATLSAAKFQHTYDGIYREGVQSCIDNSNFTPKNITSNGNCGLAFRCVMENIPNQRQSILSSGSSILGFIPTVLLVLGNSNEDIIRIGARFPVLAFLLSITNVNKISLRNRSMSTAPSGSLSLGPYGSVCDAGGAARSSKANLAIIIGAHICAALGAATVVWQTKDLGRKAVVTWACWTDFYPLIWVCVAVLHHLLATFFLRLSLRVHHSNEEKAPHRNAVPSRSGLEVWCLMYEDQRTEIAHKRLLKWSKAFTDLLNNLDFLYGTAVLSSLTLVSGSNAICVLSVYGGVAVVSRFIALVVLETMETLD